MTNSCAFSFVSPRSVLRTSSMTFLALGAVGSWARTLDKFWHISSGSQRKASIVNLLSSFWLSGCVYHSAKSSAILADLSLIDNSLLKLSSCLFWLSESVFLKDSRAIEFDVLISSIFTEYLCSIVDFILFFNQTFMANVAMQMLDMLINASNANCDSMINVASEKLGLHFACLPAANGSVYYDFQCLVIKGPT